MGEKREEDDRSGYIDNSGRETYQGPNGITFTMTPCDIYDNKSSTGDPSTWWHGLTSSNHLGNIYSNSTSPQWFYIDSNGNIHDWHETKGSKIPKISEENKKKLDKLYEYFQESDEEGE